MRLRAILEEQGATGTTADAVYQALRHSILHRDLAPGESREAMRWRMSCA
jgi:DNA-binding GntR family transcriptional regulator